MVGTPKHKIVPPPANIEPPDSQTVVLGLRTLGSFDFEGHSLLQVDVNPWLSPSLQFVTFWPFWLATMNLLMAFATHPHSTSRDTHSYRSASQSLSLTYSESYLFTTNLIGFGYLTSSDFEEHSLLQVGVAILHSLQLFDSNFLNFLTPNNEPSMALATSFDLEGHTLIHFSLFT